MVISDSERSIRRGVLLAGALAALRVALWPLGAALARAVPGVPAPDLGRAAVMATLAWALWRRMGWVAAAALGYELVAWAVRWAGRPRPAGLVIGLAAAYVLLRAVRGVFALRGAGAESGAPAA